MSPGLNYEPPFSAMPPSYEVCVTAARPAPALPKADYTIQPLAMTALFDWESLLDEE
jgi:hypothetical protein